MRRSPTSSDNLKESRALNANHEIEALRRAAARCDTHDPDVSQWTVGMHVHHCCLATTAVCESLLASEPPTPRAPRSVLTAAVFLFGRIPRGRGKSPEQAMPEAGVSREDLDAMLDASAEGLRAVAATDPRKWFRHFSFGVMDRDRTLKFVRIHNRHHLRIIADIIKSTDGRKGATAR
ncbi:MAG: DinB family protein [marine benthic group bacterium]|nr:DinB family protein [Gemmatimonadota bacterium]MCL7981412.1 DinB family protein [Gemmatimonadota bacterium]